MEIIAGTGHRPQRVGGYSDAAYDKLVRFATAELQLLSPSVVISGMALGWDQALARAALNLDVTLYAYVPFDGQDALWPPASRQRYAELMARATVTRVCSPGGYAAYKMQDRNQCMVDDCTKLLALWDGSASGTQNCVLYAEHCKRLVINCWKRFEAFI